MSLAQSMLAEFEAQAPITRKFLERLPEDKLTWKPHDKSMSAGQLALHLANVPGAIVQFVRQNAAAAPKFGAPQPASVQEVLAAHDQSVAAVRELLPQYGDASMQQTWTLENEGKTLISVPRGEFLRNIMLNHWYQHRGQFSVYLRLLNVSVPSSYGPSADELPAFLQQAQSA
jgi:uncharacterized damage-inducible protein DinB